MKRLDRVIRIEIFSRQTSTRHCSTLGRKLKDAHSHAERERRAADYQTAIEELAAVLERTAPNMKVCSADECLPCPHCSLPTCSRLLRPRFCG